MNTYWMQWDKEDLCEEDMDIHLEEVEEEELEEEYDCCSNGCNNCLGVYWDDFF